MRAKSVDDRRMSKKGAVKRCGECPTCRYTRAATKSGLRYRFARLVQRTCPFCRAANRKAGRDFQKSPKLDA
jgi:ssDNA-binding Zn-finger/Zn-ribbon topoisomerase 1